tara:strand:+ start:406 stop:519 length:114 start_codon:yes stop_codon:yes gene_type:complete
MEIPECYGAGDALVDGLLETALVLADGSVVVAGGDSG